jgi:hypothetical protein
MSSRGDFMTCMEDRAFSGEFQATMNKETAEEVLTFVILIKKKVKYIRIHHHHHHENSQLMKAYLRQAHCIRSRIKGDNNLPLR